MSGLSFPFAVIALILDIVRIKLNQWLLDPFLLPPWKDYKFLDPALPTGDHIWSIGEPLVFMESYAILSIFIYILCH